jgi:hypothetical protein
MNLSGILVLVWLIDHFVFDGRLGCIFDFFDFHDKGEASICQLPG